MHDALPPGEFTKERVERVDKIFVKSNFHRSLYPEVPDDKFILEVTESANGFKAIYTVDPANGRALSIKFLGDKFIMNQTPIKLI